MSAIPSKDTRRQVSDSLAAQAALARRSLQDFVPLSSRGYSRPYHLKPLTDGLESIFIHKKPGRIVCHAPPRHGKTDTVLRFIAWCIWQNPKIRIAYCTYGADLSHEKARVARDLCVELGVKLSAERVDRWQTTEGGGMWSVGVMGPLTGKGFDIIIIDDPFKNRVEAESPTYRDRVREWFRAVARTRLEPGGSIIVFATRWHPDDLSGTLIKESYTNIHLPAIDAKGRPLWPERFNIPALRDIEVDVHPYTWESLYQGRPRPRGATVFKGVHTYAKLPAIYDASFGVDLAYSKKKTADHSAVVKMLYHQGYWYVAYAHRAQVRPRIFKKRCRKLHRAEPHAPWLWYGSTTEQGAADLFNEPPRSVPLEWQLTEGDKFVRAMNYADKWNKGRVLLPADAPWLNEFVAEHLSFTGNDDDEDDQVDAGVAAFDLLTEGQVDIDEKPKKGKATGLAAEEL
jgi:predicted phage terminase large subunit-like protein